MEPKCQQCGGSIAEPVKRNITDRVRCQITRKQRIRTREMTFCSAKCGAHYQMGCEG